MISLSRPSTRRSSTDEEGRPSPALTGALWIAAIAAVALSLGAVLPVVSEAMPGFASTSLLIMLAVAPVTVAISLVLLRCGVLARRHTAAGILMGLAAFTPGRLALDLQLVADASQATRPELYLPADLEDPTGGPGLVFLLAGHLLTAAAGLLAAWFVRAQAEAFGQPLPGRHRWQVVVPTLSTVAGIGLLMAPMRSENVYLLAHSPFEGPFPASAGYLLLAGVLPLGGLLATGSSIEGLARGALLGLASAVFAVALPALIAGISVPTLGLTPGPVLALSAAAGLIVVSFFRFSQHIPFDKPVGTVTLTWPDLAGEARLPGLGWLRRATGALGLVTAVTAAMGAASGQLASVSGLPVPDSPARGLLGISGAALGILAVLTVLPVTSKAIRPVLSVAWVGVPLTGASVLGTALAVTELRSTLYSAGTGVFWTIAAMALAAVTAGCSVVAGVVERDGVDLDSPLPNGKLVSLLIAAGILAVAAFGTPTFAAPGYVAPGLWSNFGAQSWGSLAALVTILGALVLVPRSRPASAAALLLGATVVVALRGAELPLLAHQIEGAQASTGFWLALVCVIVLMIAALAVVASARTVRRKPV